MIASGGVAFRRALREDFLAIAALDRQAWGLNPNSEFIPDGEHVWRHWVDDALVFCAREGDRVVGAAVSFPCLDGRFCLHKVMVDPDYRGQGIASRLMALLLENLDTRGGEAFLTVDPGNTPAIRLYEQWGFCEHRFEPGYYRPYEDRFILTRPAREPSR